MPNKLQELTDKLYNEGLSKGKQEAEEMKAGAKKEAAKIIADAKDEAKKIVADARKEALEMKSKVENDLKMASTQTISSIRQKVESTIITKVLSSPIKASMSETDFVKSVILTVAKAFNAANAEPVSLELVLPAAMQEQFRSFIENECRKEMGKGLNVTYSKQIAGGFKIGPKEDGYMISFSEGDFEKIFADYLRPTTKNLLFGK